MVGIYRPTGISEHDSPQNGKIVQKWVFDRATNRFIPVQKKVAETDVTESASTSVASPQHQEQDRLDLLKKELIRLEEKKLQAEIRLLELRVQKEKKKRNLAQVSANSSVQPKNQQVERNQAPEVAIAPVATRSLSEKRRTSPVRHVVASPVTRVVGSPVRRIVRKTHESPKTRKLLPLSPIKAIPSLLTTANVPNKNSESRPGSVSNFEPPLVNASHSTTDAWCPTKTTSEKASSLLPRSKEANVSTNAHVSDDDSDSDSSEEVPSRVPQHEQKERPESKNDLLPVRNRTIPPVFEDYTLHNNLSLDSSSSSSSSSSYGASRPLKTESMKGAANPFSFRRMDNEENLPESTHSRNLGHHSRRTIKQESFDVGGTETSTNNVRNSDDGSIIDTVESGSFPRRKIESNIQSKTRPSEESSRRLHQQPGDSGDSSIDSSFDPRQAVPGRQNGQVLPPLLNQASDSVNTDAASYISDASGGVHYRYTPTKYNMTNNSADPDRGVALETPASLSEGSMSAITNSDSSEIQQIERTGGKESGNEENSRLESLRSERNKQRKQIEEKFEKMLPDNRHAVHLNQNRKALFRSRNGAAPSYADGYPESPMNNAYQVNMATAVLVYLKQINMEETARKFQREWKNVHGNLPLGFPTIIGTIRFEPLLREDSSFSSDSASSTASVDQESSLDDKIEEAKESSPLEAQGEHRHIGDSYSAEKSALAAAHVDKVDKDNSKGNGLCNVGEKEGGENDSQHVQEQHKSTDLKVGYLGDSECYRSEGDMDQRIVRSVADQVELESKGQVAASSDDNIIATTSVSARDTKTFVLVEDENQCPEQTAIETESASEPIKNIIIPEFTEFISEASAEDEPVVSGSDAVIVPMNLVSESNGLTTVDDCNVTQHATDAGTKTSTVCVISEEERDSLCGIGISHEEESSSMNGGVQNVEKITKPDGELEAETVPEETVFATQRLLEVDDDHLRHPTLEKSRAQTKSENQTPLSKADIGFKMEAFSNNSEVEEPVKDPKAEIESEDQAVFSKVGTGSNPTNHVFDQSELYLLKPVESRNTEHFAEKPNGETGNEGEEQAISPKSDTGLTHKEGSTSENEPSTLNKDPNQTTEPTKENPKAETESRVDLDPSEDVAALVPKVAFSNAGDHSPVTDATDAKVHTDIPFQPTKSKDGVVVDPSASETREILSSSDADVVITDTPSTNASTCLDDDPIQAEESSVPVAHLEVEPTPMLTEASPHGDDDQSVVSDHSDYVTLVLDNPELDVSEISISEPLEEIVLSSRTLKAMQNVEKMSYIREESIEGDPDTNIEEKIITKPIAEVDSSSEEESSEEEEESSSGVEEASSEAEETTSETSEEEVDSSSGIEEASSEAEETTSEDEEEESSSGVEEASREGEETTSDDVEEDSSSEEDETTEADDSQTSGEGNSIPLPTPKATASLTRCEESERQPPIPISKTKLEEKPPNQVFRDRETKDTSINDDSEDVGQSAPPIKRSHSEGSTVAFSQPPQKRSVGRSVSFDDDIRTVELPRWDDETKKALFYDSVDLRGFKMTEKARQERKASEIIAKQMNSTIGAATVGMPSFFDGL